MLIIKERVTSVKVLTVGSVDRFDKYIVIVLRLCILKQFCACLVFRKTEIRKVSLPTCSRVSWDRKSEHQTLKLVAYLGGRALCNILPIAWIHPRRSIPTNNFWEARHVSRFSRPFLYCFFRYAARWQATTGRLYLCLTGLCYYVSYHWQCCTVYSIGTVRIKLLRIGRLYSSSVPLLPTQKSSPKHVCVRS